MAKYDFNNSNYSRMWGVGDYDRKVLVSVVNNEKIIGTNPSWYKTQGSLDPNFTPCDSKGLATFTVEERDVDASVMASLRAPLGDTDTIESTGLRSYSATIPDFITRKIAEKAMERRQREELYEQMGGSDRSLIRDIWAPKVNGLLTERDYTMNWMTAQLMTKGCINYQHGKGVFAPLHKANIPEKNLTHAVKTAWTDGSAKIITEMQTIEGNFREQWGYDGGMQWQMTKKFFLNVFLKNSEVLEKVNEFRTLNDLISVTFNTINTDVFNNAWESVRLAYGLSPIVLVEEKEYDQDKATGEVKSVQGWEDKYVVLRPTGDAVTFVRKQVLDQTYAQYLNESIQRNFAPLADGFGILVNSTVPSGMYKEWHTTVMFSVVPALIEMSKHVIVDVSRTA